MIDKKSLMKYFIRILLTAIVVYLPNVATPKPPHLATYEYINGWWFNGQSFEKKVMYSTNGIFTEGPGPKIDSTIDLNNRFIVPAFSEAHTHALEGFGDMDGRIRRYLSDGVFYVKNPNNVRAWTKNLFPKINNHLSLDGSFANAGLTSTGGHPERLYEEHIRPHIPNLPAGWFNGNAYFTIDSEKDLNEKWGTILEEKPDFIKVYLANSEFVNKALPDTKFPLRKGLNPAIVPLIVNKAHANGLRVTCHVETATDFRNAMNAGVDEINHTPGFYLQSKEDVERYRLTKQDAELAASKNIVVVTALLSRTLVEDPSLLPLVEQNQAYNLKLLAASRVKIAIGSDHAESPTAEIKALRDLNIFDNRTLLKMWCETSALTIFPKRKIGLLTPGYEASFLALDGNPLEDFNNTSKISMRCKQGHFIKIQ